MMGAGALLIWFVIGRGALKRIDRMSEAEPKIMGGDLAQRLPVDRHRRRVRPPLRQSLNAMLGRIEQLNEGLARSPTTSPTT